MHHREFDIEGMNCSHCSGSVDRAIRELPGVTSCRVNLEEGRATVEAERVDDAAVVTAVEGLGFRAKVRTAGP